MEERAELPSVRVVFSPAQGDPSVREARLAGRRAIVPSVVLGTALFLFTEVMIFGGLIAAYSILRALTPAWPPAGQPRLPIAVSGINSLVLLAGGAAMWPVVRAIDAGRARAWRHVVATALLGASFLCVQGYEWVRLLSFGLKTTSSLYGTLFYSIVGLHGLHVLGALGMLVYLATRLARDDGTSADRWRESLTAARLYWSFVVIVWPLLYVLVYLS